MYSDGGGGKLPPELAVVLACNRGARRCSSPMS